MFTDMRAGRVCSVVWDLDQVGAGAKAVLCFLGMSFSSGFWRSGTWTERQEDREDHASV